MSPISVYVRVSLNDRVSFLFLDRCILWLRSHVYTLFRESSESACDTIRVPH